jgi:predicted RNA binding protein YcfA (HicA-like mRNA interferase family)
LSKDPRLNAAEAEKLLIDNGFNLIRTKGSHRIYVQGDKRIVMPFYEQKFCTSKLLNKFLTLLSKIKDNKFVFN